MMRALELFSGIGGFAAAVAGRAEVVAAYDQSGDARATYALNFPGARLVARNLDRVSADELARHRADLWWLSPPCEPYTLRGARRDLDDTRARSLLVLLEILTLLRPRHVALENVAGFATSRARVRGLEMLTGAGYHVREALRCPTELGLPMRRPRYYLAASQEPLREPAPLAALPLPLTAFLDAAPDPALAVPADFAARHARAFHVVDPADPTAIASCFGSSYGHACHGAGSVIRTAAGLRFFSPPEMARLLGLPEPFHFPESLPLTGRWRLLGNSLAVPAVREIVALFCDVGDSSAPALAARPES